MRVRFRPEQLEISNSDPARKGKVICLENLGVDSYIDVEMGGGGAVPVIWKQ